MQIITRLSSRHAVTLPSPLEKLPQDGGTRLLQHPAPHHQLWVKRVGPPRKEGPPRLRAPAGLLAGGGRAQEVGVAPVCAQQGVGGTVDEGADAGLQQGAGAHDAGLEGDVQRGVAEPPPRQLLSRLFCVYDRVSCQTLAHASRMTSISAWAVASVVASTML